MRPRFVLLSPLLAAAMFFLAACGSSGETLVVTQRPQPGYQPPADTVTGPPALADIPGLDTVEVGDFPAGRMWLLDDLPAQYFQSRYGFEPDTSWLNRVRLATVRLPNCTAAFVSEDGLLVTNYHCVRDQLPDLEERVDSVRPGGFVADSLSAGFRVEDWYADQLLGISDVTQRVRSRIDHLVDDDRRDEVLRRTLESLEEELTSSAKQRDTTQHVEVVSLYSGTRYAAYTFRRIHDLRFVMVPEQAAGRFGGDTQNFTYPRYTLDVSFLRAYDAEGRPFKSTAHFDWSEDGVRAGTAVFTAGNPGATHRLRTLSQLEFERDYELPVELAVLGARAAALQQFISQHPADADSFDVESTLQSLRNVQKDARGRLDALNDPNFLRRVTALAARIDEALSQRDSLQREYRDAVRSLAAVQRTKRASAAHVAPFALFGSELIDSHILIRAIYAYLYDFTRQRGAPEEFVAEYRTSGREVEPLPTALETALLAARLRELQDQLGVTEASLRTVLGGRTAEVAAREIVEGTSLVDSIGFDSVVAAGYLASGDPTVELAEAVVPLYLAVAQQQGSLQAREERLMGDIAEARLAVSDSLPPDGTFTLRLSDGVVSGYPYHGTLAPPYTTFLGMYDAYHSFENNGDFQLPEQWIDPPESFDRETPLNFVSTVDLTGGSSGSPVFRQDLSLVGIAFDSNVQALQNVYFYSEEAGRGIAVDTRGVTEVLRDLYRADDLLEELEEGSAPGVSE